MQSDGTETHLLGPDEYIEYFLGLDPELDGRPIGGPLAGRYDAGVDAPADAGVPAYGDPDGFLRKIATSTSLMTASCSAASMLTVSPSMAKTARRSARLTLVPVKSIRLGGEPGLHGRLDLAGGDGVDPGAPAPEQAEDPPVGIGLHGVADPGLAGRCCGRRRCRDGRTVRGCGPCRRRRAASRSARPARPRPGRRSGACCPRRRRIRFPTSSCLVSLVVQIQLAGFRWSGRSRAGPGISRGGARAHRPSRPMIMF